MTDEWMAGAGSACGGELFGDGRHPTTELAIGGLLHELASRARGASVLDAGCGTGRVAAIAAALGARVTAIDIEPRAALATAARVPSARVLTGSLEDELAAPDRFDIVVANISEPTLSALLPALREVLAPGGALVATGATLACSRAVRLAAARWGAIRQRALLGYALTVVTIGESAK